ncbi:O-succinylbenzoic acid--CoA ligase [Pedococcus cremeus]|uniref:O-succinylbenzoic acid--CoA ligase n=1 Tax=Pedococcus cremeus TaxID=587636 RepID=A0A1H9XST6_9MICO|nr:o-succinylbenzoate--CoA ligase [Pedococcus cremeus]SES49211.1 O-succinylbenzoic acid--CoA ligase [Pedococcus cremeus]
MTRLQPLEVPSGTAAAQVLPALRAALDGGPAVMPYAAGAQAPTAPDAGGPLPDGLALVVGTSGSTGSPKLAMLTRDALLASATATHERLGGPGQWLLPMPAHHIAGIQVLVRSIVAGTRPVVADLSAGFTPAAFAEAAAGLDAGLDTGLDSGRRYTSVVPTQLVRLLADKGGTEALRRFDAVLVGGAATAPALLARAREAGVRVTTTYGMSETAGGCVYDGLPLSCSRARAGTDGRIQLGGDTLAAGYLGRPDLTREAFTTDPDGTRWFTTDDVGHLDAQGRWHVDGRIDDLVTTGGLKVAPRLVEEAIGSRLPDVAECAVVGVADPEWGEVVAAALVLADGSPAPGLADVRDALRDALPGHALPRRVAVVDTLPLRGPGKPDRAALRALLADSS